MNEDTKQVAVVERGAFASAENFELAQRMAKALASSTIVPQTYRDNLADCVIALEMAQRIGANPLAVMQNLYIVHGRPAWSSQFLISCVNASGKFSPLRYRATGTRGDDSWGCVAWAVDKAGERLEGPEVTIGMAKGEGWFQKNGSKWKTMPELMLRYRAATLFARLFAPELTMGLHVEDEIIDVAPVVTEVAFARAARQVAPADDSNPELNPVTKPATLAATVKPEPTRPTTVPASERLAALMSENGISFDVFRRIVGEAGMINDADSLSSFSDIKDRDAARLLLGKDKLVAALKGALL